MSNSDFQYTKRHYLSDPQSTDLNTVDIWIPRAAQTPDDGKLWVMFDFPTRGGRGLFNIDPSLPDDPSRNVHYPSHLEDVAHALLYLEKEYHIGNGYLLSGHSCGATLAFELNNGVVPENPLPVPNCVLGIAGIYDFEAFVQAHSGVPVYKDFMDSAFPDKSVWETASPCPGRLERKTLWECTETVIISHSDEDELIERNQADLMLDRVRMTACFKDKVHFLKARSNHDQIWENGEILASLISSSMKLIANAAKGNRTSCLKFRHEDGAIFLRIGRGLRVEVEEGSKAGAFFTTYEGVKSVLTKVNPTSSRSETPLIPQPFIHSTASSIAELVSCLILTPAEVLKQNAQMIRKGSSTSSVFGPSVTFQALEKFKRPSQLWRGYTALAARNLPFTAMQFPMLEHLKISIQTYRKKNGTFTGSLLETGIITALSAGTAGSIAAVITTPIDVVKTRIMLSAAAGKSDAKTKREVEILKKQGQIDKLACKDGVTRKSSLTIAREVLNENGVKGLFRGGTLRAVWTALGSGLYLGVYESGKVLLGKRHESE
ncbi:hypothetical protein B7494_g3167 [Chlorociboria aeruginascens]|nr:hypothetical protein B7494_g3167 [Chlorociboria aeruginascens]